MPYGIANKNRQVNRYEIADILDLAWKSGIYTIDTAKTYGTSEEMIGGYLKDHTGSSWEIITKISDGEKNIAAQVQDSTEKLTVCPSAVLAHSADLFLNDEFQSGLTEVKEKQLIRKIGVSLYTEDEIDQVLESVFKPDIVQLPLNILDTRLYRHGILSHLVEKGIEIHSRSAFLQGLFFMPETELNNHFSDALPYLKKLKSIAARADLTLAELSLLWLISLDEVIKVVIGVENIDQLKMHLKTLEKSVDPAVFEEVLFVHYENESVLNPSLWPSTS
jgi:aryl-alcohol dehydrogenase-like predicted oxidoreductase